MPDTTFDAEAARSDLRTARRDSPTNDRTVARVHAEAAVSQAVSLSVIANALEDLARALWPAEAGGDDEVIERLPDYRKLVIGDVVMDTDGAELHVEQIGESEGEQWVDLIGSRGVTFYRVWSRHLAYVRHDSAATDVTAAVTPDVEAAGPDESFDVEVDFEQAGAPDEAAEAAKADAFTAARKATGKAKKGKS